MTILFAGGEDTSFALTGTSGGARQSSEFRTTFARCSLWASNVAASDPPANRWTSPVFTAGSDLWLHCVMTENVLTQTANAQVFLFYSPDNVARVLVRTTATSGQWKVSTQNAAGTKTDVVTASANHTTNHLTTVDIHVDFGASGGVTMWYDGVQVASYSGSLRTDAATQLDHFAFSSATNSGVIGDNTQWSEFIAANEDTTSMSLWTLAPVASGNTQSWTPNTVGNINEVIINDATSVSTTTNNALSQWTTPVTAPSGAWNVRAIVQEARLQRGATGPQHADFSLRTASTDYVAGSTLAVGTSFSNFGNALWLTNPNTSAAWAITDIASGFNLGVKAIA